MNESMNESTVSVIDQITVFHLPRYNEIPNVGLYLKQVVKYINETLQPVFQIKVTETMLSNYVKMHLVPNPIKKQYYREQISTLIFIVLSKSVLSLDNLQMLIKLQTEKYDIATAYDYFCNKFENVLQYVYGIKDSIDLSERDSISSQEPSSEDAENKKLVHNIIITVAHKFYLDYCFTKLS